MADIQHRFIQTNGIRMHIAEMGEGPLVILCHGFPESWYSWRHQIRAIAEAGFRVVAPDQRGYGQTDAPADNSAYTQLHLVGDIVGLLEALGEETAVIAGHDWGAPVAWNAAMMRPDRFRAVIGLSVPFSDRGPMRPTEQFKQMFGDRFFYILYFQEPGKAEAELEADVRRTQRMLLYSASGNSHREPGLASTLPKSARFLDGMREPETLPPWLTEADLDFFTGEFERSGFRGGLNWYRNMDRTWELTAAFQGARIRQPALFISGDRDIVPMTPESIAGIKALVPGMRDVVVLPGAGHWTQQEKPAEVNGAMISFLKSL
jgi:pimeloyl-ACP methyl ester carboxylesterase